MEFSTPYPGYHSLVSKSVSTIGEILTGNGYGTSCFGKNHNVPDWQTTPAGPFYLWPTGLGFEYFYGFLGADAHQFRPAIYEGTTPLDPYLGKEDSYILDNDLANKSIKWNSKRKRRSILTNHSSLTTRPARRMPTMPRTGSPNSMASSRWMG